MRYQKFFLLVYPSEFELFLKYKIIIKLIDHVQVTEKFIGKELHVARGRALGELRSHLLVGVAVATVQQSIRRRNSHGLNWRLELTVS